MAISLYDTTVLGFIQIGTAVEGFLQRGLAHCEATGTDPALLVEARLIDDTLPLRFQILSVIHHSLGAVQGAQRGTFSPPPQSSPLDYPALQQALAQANAQLKAFSPEEINALQGRDMVFQLPERQLPFVVQDFLLSIS